jgi:hypothetical protein
VHGLGEDFLEIELGRAFDQPPKISPADFVEQPALHHLDACLVIDQRIKL